MISLDELLARNAVSCLWCDNNIPDEPVTLTIPASQRVAEYQTAVSIAFCSMQCLATWVIAASD